MYCPNCGKELEDGSAFCAYCGEKIESQTEYGNAYDAQQSAPVYGQAAPAIDRTSVSKKEYIDKYAPAQLKKNIKSAVRLCYVLAVASAFFSVVWNHNFWGLIEVAILVGLTIGIDRGKSKGCAIALLVISILECAIATISYGMPAGWWWILASGLIVSAFKKLDKEYDLFLIGGAQTSAYAPSPVQPFAPNPEPVQAPAQTDVYYTPSQPTEPENLD